jgi:hypothetical protein
MGLLRSLIAAEAGELSHKTLVPEPLERRQMLSAAVVHAKPDYLLEKPHGANAPYTYSAPVGKTPAQIRQAYGIDQISFGSITGDGTGQTIAIIDAYDDPTIQSDLQAFDAAFSLPDPPSFDVVAQDGSSNLPSPDPAHGWGGETSLDVEWAHALAPNAKLLLVEASSDDSSDLEEIAVPFAANYPGVSVVSMSFGSPEDSTIGSLNSIFSTPNAHQGVSFIASSGDSGAYVSATSRQVAPSYPALAPGVLAVGGTTLSLNFQDNWSGETAWGSSNFGNFSGSGGGISKYQAQPSYQTGVVTQSTTRRTVPDVAFDADPASGVAVYDSYDNSASRPWDQVGGTSFSAPSWAALVAIANQGRVINGKGTFNGATQLLPAIYQLPASDFHDITQGNNGAYYAGTGYDLVTGRGTPIANQLVPDLAGGSSLNQNHTPAITAISDTSIDQGSTFTTTGSFTDPDSSDTWTATVNYGDGSGTQPLALNSDKSFTLNHLFASNGLHSVIVSVTDNHNALGTASFNITVNDVAPTVTLANTEQTFAGTPVYFTGSFADPGPTDSWTATVDYDEGNGPVPLTLSANKTFSLNPVFASPGTYSATVTVTDQDGQSGQATTQITVADLPGITADVGAIYTIAGTPTAPLLTITNGNVTFGSTFAGANPDLSVDVTGGASLTLSATTALSSLTIESGATVTFTAAANHANHGVLVVNSLSNDGLLDLNDNDLIVRNGDLASVQSLLASGRNVGAGGIADGTWNGPQGIASSAAAARDASDGQETVVLALARNGDLPLGAFKTFDGQVVGSNDLLIKYTYNGDMNLDGVVNNQDVAIIAGFYDNGATTNNYWAFGDLNGDGKVDNTDVTILAGFYGNGTASSGLQQL